MKKSKLVLGILAVLGVAWIGGAWFTGSTVEKKYQGYLAKLNEQMSEEFDVTGVMGKIDNVQLNRGVFSSDYRYDLIITFPDDKWIIPMEGKLYHGPLPLNHLAKFNLMPVMFSDVYRLAETEHSKAIFANTKGKSLISGEYSMSYSQQIKGYTDIAEGKFDTNSVELTWSKGELTFDTDINGLGDVDAELGKFSILATPENDDANFEQFLMEYEDIKMSTDLKPTKWKNLYTGLIKLEVDKVKYAVSSDNPVNFEVKDIEMVYDVQNEKDFFDYQTTASGEMKLNDIPLGKLEVDLKFNHLFAEALDRLMITDPNNQAEIQALGTELVQNQPHFIISPLKLTNTSGKIEGNLNLEFDKIDNVELAPGKHLSLFKQLSFNLHADKAAIEEILSHLAQAKGMTKTDAENGARLEMENALPNLLQNGLIQDKGNFVTSRLDLDKAQNGVNFNDKFISEDALGMIAFGLLMNFAK